MDDSNKYNIFFQWAFGPACIAKKAPGNTSYNKDGTCCENSFLSGNEIIMKKFSVIGRYKIFVDKGT